MIEAIPSTINEMESRSIPITPMAKTIPNTNVRKINIRYPRLRNEYTSSSIISTTATATEIMLSAFILEALVTATDGAPNALILTPSTSPAIYSAALYMLSSSTLLPPVSLAP